MLDNIGGLELVVIVLAALFIIGPERLPKVLADVMGGIRKMRSMARSATSDLSRELGTTIELEDLHPKTFLRKHLLSEAEEDALRKPFQQVYREMRGAADEVRGAADALNLRKEPAPDLGKEPAPSLRKEPAPDLGKEPAPSLRKEPAPSRRGDRTSTTDVVAAEPPVTTPNGRRPSNTYDDAT